MDAKQSESAMIVFLFCFTSALVMMVGGHYSLRMQLSSPVVRKGDSVSVTCEIEHKLNTSATFVFVKKTIDHDHVKIASNRVVEQLFQRTGRYRIELRRNDTDRLRHVWYTLRIANAQSSDAGIIGCRIPSRNIELTKELTVLVPVETVRLLSRDSAGSHVQSYVGDGDRVKFRDGEIRQVLCRVNGSNPAPTVRVFVDQLDITDQFTETTDLITVGPSVMKGLQPVYYKTELVHSAMSMTFNLSDKQLRCVANVPRSNFTDQVSWITVAFDKYGPKFIECAESLIRRRLYDKDVSIDCDVQAEPVVDHVTVEWAESPTRNVTLSAGRRDGHLFLLLQPTNTSNIVRRMTLRFDRLFPQHFTNYTLRARNSQGVAVMHFQLARDDSARNTAVTTLLHSSTRQCLFASSLIIALSFLFIAS